MTLFLIIVQSCVPPHVFLPLKLVLTKPLILAALQLLTPIPCRSFTSDALLMTDAIFSLAALKAFIFLSFHFSIFKAFIQNNNTWTVKLWNEFLLLNFG